MASLMKIGRIPTQLSRNKTVYLYNIVRNHWNKDYKPGPYPETEEERQKAAKKYNLSREEYEPYPDDGLSPGDYPKLPAISGDSRDPYYPWDFPEHKRNYNEPLHADADAYGEDRFDVSGRQRYSGVYYFSCFFGVLGVSAAIFYWMENYKMFRPVLEKQLPKPGVTHYTFEPAN